MFEQQVSKGKRRMINPDGAAFGHRHMLSDVADLDRKPACRVVRAGAEFASKQGHLLASGISAQSVGARRLHLQIARIPPGTRATIQGDPK
jgi:uncharacterized RmlC-like cupin family protein